MEEEDLEGEEKDDNRGRKGEVGEVSSDGKQGKNTRGKKKTTEEEKEKWSWRKKETATFRCFKKMKNFSVRKEAGEESISSGKRE